MRACSATALPLLAATVIAILTFMPIYYSPHIRGIAVFDGCCDRGVIDV